MSDIPGHGVRSGDACDLVNQAEKSASQAHEYLYKRLRG